MYNGIGLATPRGTATNGHVQRNLAYRRDRSGKHEVQEYEAPKVRKPNKEILDHQRKRAVELKLVEWAEETKLFENNSDEEAEKLMAEKRAELTDLQNSGKLDSSEQNKDSHQRSAAKEREVEKFRLAMRIHKDYEPGNAFNEDYQQTKKNQRYEEALEREKRKYLANQERKEKQRQSRIEYDNRRSRESRKRSRSPSPRRYERRGRYRSRSRSPRDSKRRRYHSPSYSPDRRRSRSPIQSRRNSRHSSRHSREKSPTNSKSPQRRSPSPRASRSASRSNSPEVTSRRKRYSTSPSPKRESRNLSKSPRND